LRECLNSIVLQTYQNFEVILINDGSTDNSPIIAQEFAKRFQKIKLIDQVNSGSAAAKNMGLRHALGEYVLFIDADDWIETSLLQHIETRLQHETIDLLIFDAKTFDEKQNYFHTFYDVDNFDFLVKRHKNSTFNSKAEPELLELAPAAWKK